MKLLLSLAVLVGTLGVLYSAPEDQPTGISEDTLKRESAQRNLHESLFYVYDVLYLRWLRVHFYQQSLSQCLIYSKYSGIQSFIL